MTDEAIKLAKECGATVSSSMVSGKPITPLYITFTPSQLITYFERAKQIGRDEAVQKACVEVFAPKVVTD